MKNNVTYISTSLLITLMLMLFSSQSMALEVRAEIDKNPVIADESFTLTITANDDLPRNLFRSDALLGSFIVGATSVDRSTHMINGEMTRQTRWRVTLIARRPGQYEIPSFDIDGTRTSPIVVDVVEPGQNTGERGPVFITASVDNETPYIQQQVRYTVNLHLAHTLESGSISPPEVSNADIQQASSDEERQEIIDGQRYRIITRTYFITPRRSGALTIAGSRFDGQVRDSSSRSFATFSRPQSVSALAADIELDVIPQPDNYQGHWLPSEQVSLSEDWDEQQRFIVGEPINRRITVTAQGVRDEQLPDISVSYPQGLRYYPERTERESFSRQGQRVAQAEFRGIIIPANAGTFELPEVEIQWWDVNRQQVRTAIIEARTIEVHEPAGGLASPLAQPEVDAPQGLPSPPMLPHTSTQTSWWSPAATILLALWLATLACLAWLRVRTKHIQKEAETKEQQRVPARSRAPLRALKKACMANDANASKQALQSWLKSRSNSPQTPLEFASAMNSPSLTQAITSLERALYAADKGTWQDGPLLWRNIQSLHRSQQSLSEKNELPELYPQ